MRIGILQCDNVRSSLSTEFGEFPEMFKQGFRLADKKSVFTFHIYRAHEGVLPDELGECDAYIITGGRFSVLDTDELWIHQLQSFIVRLNKAMIKTIGISFGHQIMAVAMGGKVERADCGWQIGVHCNKVLRQQDFMQSPREIFHVATLCEDQVVSIGDSATILAEADYSEFAMLQYGKHMLSLQGHPEFSYAFAKAALTVRQEDFPSKRFELGMKSFEINELDGMLLFNWFICFLLDNQKVAISN